MRKCYEKQNNHLLTVEREVERERERKGVKQMVNLVRNEVCLRGDLHCAEPITICKLFYKT